MQEKFIVLALFNACGIILAYLFKSWISEAWHFVKSNISDKIKYCEQHKPFGLWRAFNRVVMSIAIYKWLVTCILIDVYVAYRLLTGLSPFG